MSQPSGLARETLPSQRPASYAELSTQLRRVMPEAEWLAHLPLVTAIQKLKAARRAVVLAHNYQTPEIFYGVADFRGDSLALARHAAESDADVVVVCGVRFMAETAKLLNPEKTVLLPDSQAGCSLASAITAQDIRDLRRAHPGAPVVCYVNTSAEVKAECDMCCTSANAVEAVESLGAERVIFVPDEYLARYVAERTNVQIISWAGHCEVHERFSAAELIEYRTNTGAYVLAHPECPEDVQHAADYVGSTGGMISELAKRKPPTALLLTECSMSDNVAVAHPDIDFVRPCNLCPHMKRITLVNILESLETLKPVVDLDPDVASRARRCLVRMLEMKGAPSR